MPKRVDQDHELSRAHYDSRIGDLFLRLNSPEHDIQCHTLAMADWQDIREADAVALLAPLSTHQSTEVRHLVALQLAMVAGSAEDVRALQALVTLAVDDDLTVRTAAARSSYIVRAFNLTQYDQSAKSLGNRYVDWRQEGEITTFSFRCPDISTAKQFLAIVTGLVARQMTHRSDEKQTPPPTDRSNDLPDEPTRLPDMIMDDEQPEVFDFPRQGIPKEVLNVSKASVRLPELLIDE